MRRLVRLYPRRWRQRYGDELEQLVEDLGPMTPRIAADLVRGAVMIHGRLDMRGATSRAIGRGLPIAGLVWIVLSVVIYLTNVAYPPTTDNDTIPILIAYVLVFAALILVGVRAARAGAARRGQVLAGLVAGALIGALTAGTFFLVDNIWLSVVSQQPQKITGFTESGDASMREYVNRGLIGVLVFWTIFFGAAGAALGFAGGAAAHRGRRRPEPGRD